MRSTPLLMPWPAPGAPGGLLEFHDEQAWEEFVGGLDLDSRVPTIVAAKYARAQRLYRLAWIDFDLVKAGELAALIALELALVDRYGGVLPKRRRGFADLLRHMVVGDGLTDAKMPMVARCGGSVVGQLTGEATPSLAERRNAAAHGDPFDGAPVGGLLELVRDLIEYAYRDFIAAAHVESRA